MGWHYGCLLLLFVGLFIHASDSAGIDSLALVLQWPATFCMKEACKDGASGGYFGDFNIHGFFPQKGNERPVYCDNSSTLALSDIKSLEDELDENWRNLKPDGTNLEFWQYQWLKRGTCSLSYYDQFDYFRFALIMKRRIDLISILRQRGILPVNGYYPITEIKNAIQGATGSKPQIQCQKTGDVKLLYQVYICVAPYGQVTDCEFEDKDCDDSDFVMFPYPGNVKKQLVDIPRQPSTITSL